MSLLSKLNSRLPGLTHVISVYSLIVILIYGWTSYWLAWNLPSWLGFITLGDILGIFAYSFVVNFVESLAVLIAVLFLGVILPEKYLRGDFVLIGGFVVLYFLIFGMFLIYDFVPLQRLGQLVTVAILLFFVAQYAIRRFCLARKAIEALADRSIIFLYVTIPVTIVGLFIVFLRSI
ncbi:MAG: hypothetical protein MUO77_19370 [Anaerolineales bacterium]|nr:hypothetical protein [Anaerolineales bacterium]